LSHFLAYVIFFGSEKQIAFGRLVIVASTV